MNTTIYGDAFFDMQVQGALQSARLVVPILLDLVNPNSVIDIGCGLGAWLRAFHESGVTVIRGIDGEYIDRSSLLIDPTFFTSADLSQPVLVHGQYDLAVCLEAVEHLPSKAGRSLIRTLTSAAPLVLFSAAIPGQPGTGHVNERWPSYWQSLFAEQGFRRLDPIRGRIWQEQRVEWWYRQNIFLYASHEAISKWPALQSEAERAPSAELELIHKDILAHYTSLRAILREVPRAAVRALRHRLVRPTAFPAAPRSGSD